MNYKTKNILLNKMVDKSIDTTKSALELIGTQRKLISNYEEGERILKELNKELDKKYKKCSNQKHFCIVTIIALLCVILNMAVK